MFYRSGDNTALDQVVDNGDHEALVLLGNVGPRFGAGLAGSVAVLGCETFVGLVELLGNTLRLVQGSLPMSAHVVIEANDPAGEQAVVIGLVVAGIRVEFE